MLRRASPHRSVSSLVLITAPLDGTPPRLFARHVRGSVRWPTVRRLLPYFRRRVGGPLWLVWDRLAAHRAHGVQAYLAAHPRDFQQTFLPRHAPESNPDEQANRWVKRENENTAPESIPVLHGLARRGFRKLQHRSELLRAFFRHVGLRLT